ncbi:hypothetical protein [Chryseobacterium luteum]|uniref:Uncharacterized protein n=1 Tax=Chryseobacterium luteum TaxID=421531 RepID=A0A085YZM0_9FLAO|nr:hypothetical protein [Chryseobacterium luteum]KFE97633.1 hypothetical protein IX38_20420 [Chryseobacterium luteum]
MTRKIRFIFYILCVVQCTLFSNCSNGQNTKNIAGEYDNGLYIFDDNTFMAGGVNAVVFGTVEVNGNIITLIKHHPKQKFALYGRQVGTRLYGNTIMFQGFEDNGLVNLSENNNPPKVMRRVFNADANCVDWPSFYDNGEDCKEIYFADKNDPQLYKFELPKGVRDFVAFRFDFEDNPILYEPIVAKVADDFNSISFAANGEKIAKKPLTKKILQTKDMVMSMYERAYPEGKYYYCNPAYNIFEETGINISNYKEIGTKEEGVLQLKGSKRYEPGAENRLKFDYHSDEIIYRYEKIEAKVISNMDFSINNKSIFTFVCGTQE